MNQFSGEKFPKAHPETHPLLEAVERLLFWVPGIKKFTRTEK